MPGGMLRARRADTRLIRLPIILPESTLRYVSGTELPVLLRLVDARQKTFPLFFLRKMEEKFDDACSICVKMPLQIHDRPIAVVPDFIFIMNGIGKPFAAEDLGMHAHDQNLLVVGTVENADLSAFGKISCGPPEKVVFQFGRAGMLVAEDLATLWINAGHHMADRAVLSRCIHGLKDQQNSVPIVGVEKLLLRVQLRDVVLQKLLVLMLRFVNRIDRRRPFLEVDVTVLGNAKVFCVDFHVLLILRFAVSGCGRPSPRRGVSARPWHGREGGKRGASRGRSRGTRPTHSPRQTPPSPNPAAS